MNYQSVFGTFYSKKNINLFLCDLYKSLKQRISTWGVR